MKEELNELKEKIGTWPDYVEEEGRFTTILRLLNPEDKRIYLKQVRFHGEFPGFVKDVHQHIILSDPSMEASLVTEQGDKVYELDFDQRTEEQILRDNFNKGLEL